MKAQIRHYYVSCEETEVYLTTNECRKCKNAKSQEYYKTDKGKLVAEKSAAKQRFIRKVRQLGKLILEVETELESNKLPDSKVKQDLELIQNSMQRLCARDFSDSCALESSQEKTEPLQEKLESQS